MLQADQTRETRSTRKHSDRKREECITETKKESKSRDSETAFLLQIIPIMDEMGCKSPKFHKLLRKILWKSTKNNLNGTALVVWKTQGQICQHIHNKSAFAACYLATETARFWRGRRWLFHYTHTHTLHALQETPLTITTHWFQWQICHLLCFFFLY